MDMRVRRNQQEKESQAPKSASRHFEWVAMIFRAALVALVLFCLALVVALYRTDSVFLPYALPAAGAMLLGVSLLLVLGRRNALRYLAHFGGELSLAEHNALYRYPQPVFIVDSDNNIVWYNDLFLTEVFNGVEAYGAPLSVITTVPLEALMKDNGAEIEYGARRYLLAARQAGSNEGLTSLYMTDITKLHQLRREYQLSRPAVILMMVDNYEELIQNVRESEKAQLMGKLDKLLEDFISTSTGLLRRISQDRFLIVMEERHLRAVLESRFDILDKARSIQVNDRMCVTLSIGVGRDGSGLTECEQKARQALDMALGRGGDQAAIKTPTGFDFFGGVSKGIEKQTKVKTRIVATALIELIEASGRIFVMGHRFGDLDALGSAVGLVRVIRNMGKEAYVVVDEQHNLAQPLLKRMRANGCEDFFMLPQIATELGGRDCLLIVVDTHNPSFLESVELYDKTERVVVIDHHRKMVTHIDRALIFHHEPLASSASEMVTELIQYFGDSGRISALEAEALLAGIMLDTKNFVMRTGVRTFEAAAYLRRQGADTIAVRALFANSIEAYQRKTRLVSAAEVYRRCAICATDMQSGDMQLVAPQAADELLGISGVDASFVLYEAGNTIHLSARSLGKMNVQLVMEALGGGGHQTMAGAQLQGVALESARQSLLEAIDRYYDEHQQR